MRKILGVVLVLAGCGRALHTGLDVCRGAADVGCRRAIACHLTSKTPDECAAVVVEGCCNTPGYSCGSNLQQDDAELASRCLDAVGQLSCAGFEEYAAGTSRPFACD